VRAWIEAQLPLQRGMRERIWGEDGIFGGAKLVPYAADEDGVLHPVSEEDAKAAMAKHDAEEDRANESIALRVDQYALNLEQIRRICQAHGDLQAVVTIITEGLPPQLRQLVSPSEEERGGVVPPRHWRIDRCVGSGSS